MRRLSFTETVEKFKVKLLCLTISVAIIDIILLSTQIEDKISFFSILLFFNLFLAYGFWYTYKDFDRLMYTLIKNNLELYLKESGFIFEAGFSKWDYNLIIYGDFNVYPFQMDLNKSKGFIWSDYTFVVCLFIKEHLDNNKIKIPKIYFNSNGYAFPVDRIYIKKSKELCKDINNLLVDLTNSLKHAGIEPMKKKIKSV